MKKQAMKDLVGTITVEGKEISFGEWLEMMGGSGEILDRPYGELLKAATSPNMDWEEVHDYLIPIVKEILIVTAEEDIEAYNDLVNAAYVAWDRLRKSQLAKYEKKDSFIDFDINMRNGHAAERFEKLAEYLREGWQIERVSDNTSNDSNYYFTLINPEGEDDQHEKI